MGNFFIKSPLAGHHYKCSNLQNRGFYSNLTSRNSVLVKRVNQGEPILAAA